MSCPTCGGTTFDRIGARARCKNLVLIGYDPGYANAPHPALAQPIPLYAACGAVYVADAVIVTVL